MKKRILRSCLLFILIGSAISFKSMQAIPDIEAWDHFQIPNVINEDLFLEEDLTMVTDWVLIQASTQNIQVTTDSSVRIYGYKYKPANIFMYTLNGFGIFFDVTENGLHFKGSNRHHTFTIGKVMGDGIVEFTVGGGRHLRFAPKKD